MPPNSYWRWPYWDIQNTSFLSKTQLGAASYLKTKVYYNTFENGLDAFDDATYTTQSANGRFRSPYDDHAYGVSAEFGTTQRRRNTLKVAGALPDGRAHRAAVQPPDASDVELDRARCRSSRRTPGRWRSRTPFHVTPAVDIVGGVSYDRYEITKAEEFNAARGLFEYPEGRLRCVQLAGAR